MLENFQVGDIVEGKVTGIKPFGAFVAIDNEHQGLVHISEVAHGYVKDIHDYLSVGDEVKVKILTIDEDAGKISLSIRKTQPEPPKHGAGGRKGGGKNDPGFNTLEQKLKDWLKESNEKQAQLNKRLKK
jgi:general stress protein 13